MSRRATRTVAPGDTSAEPVPLPGKTVIALIRDIKEGRLTGTLLAREDRMRVVEHLTGEGYSAFEIAEIIRLSERTVIRDRVAIREQNALDPDPALVGQVVGHFVRSAEQVTGRLRRIARDPASRPADRIEAEKAVWTVERELVSTLQSLGYLPTAATEINARVSAGGDLPDTAELLAELERLSSLPEVHAADGTVVVTPGLGQMRHMLTRVAVAEQIESLKEARGSSAASAKPEREAEP